MAESVATGGVKTFSYPRGYKPQASKEFKIEIEDAYKKAHDRKKKERKRRAMFWILVILLIIAGIGIWYLTRN